MTTHPQIFTTHPQIFTSMRGWGIRTWVAVCAAGASRSEQGSCVACFLMWTHNWRLSATELNMDLASEARCSKGWMFHPDPLNESKTGFIREGWTYEGGISSPYQKWCLVWAAGSNHTCTNNVYSVLDLRLNFIMTHVKPFCFHMWVILSHEICIDKNFLPRLAKIDKK